MIKHVTTITICAALAGCGSFSGIGSETKRASTENELPFKAKASKNSDDKLGFAVSVSNEGAGVDAVRESVRFEGTKYCLYTNGSSDVLWAEDDASGDWSFTQDGSALVFSGRCVGR